MSTFCSKEVLTHLFVIYLLEACSGSSRNRIWHLHTEKQPVYSEPIPYSEVYPAVNFEHSLRSTLRSTRSLLSGLLWGLLWGRIWACSETSVTNEQDTRILQLFHHAQIWRIGFSSQGFFAHVQTALFHCRAKTILLLLNPSFNCPGWLDIWSMDSK